MEQGQDANFHIYNYLLPLKSHTICDEKLLDLKKPNEWSNNDIFAQISLNN